MISARNSQELTNLLADGSMGLTDAMKDTNFKAVVTNQDPNRVVDSLKLLKSVGLLTGTQAQANFNALVAWKYPWGLADALDELNGAGLLMGTPAQANFNAIVVNRAPGRVVDSLRMLKQAGLLTATLAQANFNTLVVHRDPINLASSLNKLNRFGLLAGVMAQTNYDALAAHKDLPGLSVALFLLQEISLLTGPTAQDYLSALLGHQDPYGIAYLLQILNKDGLLSGRSALANRDIIVALEEPRMVATVLDSLNRVSLFTRSRAQAHFNDIAIRYKDILLHPDTRYFWDRIPCVSFTLPRWEAMLTICNTHSANPRQCRQLLKHYVNQDIQGLEFTDEIIDDVHHINPDITSSLMSIQLARLQSEMLKFSTVVNEHSLIYLNGLKETQAGCKELLSLLDQIKSEVNGHSIKPVWAKVKTSIQQRMFQEFNVLCHYGKVSPSFVALINIAGDVKFSQSSLAKLEEFGVEAKLRLSNEASAGADFRFFTRRTDSTDSRSSVDHFLGQVQDDKIAGYR